MRPINRLSLIAAAVTSLALVACGGGDDGGDDDGQTIDPSGTHYQFVADTIAVPANQAEASMFAIDLAGTTAPDNALGGLLGTLNGLGLDIATTVDENVDSGGVIILADFQATALDTAAGVGARVFLGENPTPAACTDPEVVATCGQHFSGTASFGVKPAVSDATLVGSIVGGRFIGGPGIVTLELPLAAGEPAIVIDLVGAEMEVNITATALASGKLAGGITTDDIDNQVIPAVVDIVAGILAECTLPAPDCCVANSTGAKVLDFLDADGDCSVPEAELRANDIVSSTLLNPDLDLFDGTTYAPDVDGEKDSLSLGVGFSGVLGTFTTP